MDRTDLATENRLNSFRSVCPVDTSLVVFKRETAEAALGMIPRLRRDVEARVAAVSV
jgi:hypothetical protein